MVVFLFLSCMKGFLHRCQRLPFCYLGAYLYQLLVPWLYSLTKGTQWLPGHEEMESRPLVRALAVLRSLVDVGPESWEALRPSQTSRTLIISCKEVSVSHTDVCLQWGFFGTGLHHSFSFYLKWKKISRWHRCVFFVSFNVQVLCESMVMSESILSRPNRPKSQILRILGEQRNSTLLSWVKSSLVSLWNQFLLIIKFCVQVCCVPLMIITYY